MALDKAIFEINISDNGKSLPPSILEPKPESPAPGSGDGLANMRRRLADIGGRCQIESIPGQGLHIKFVVPLNFLAKTT